MAEPHHRYPQNVPGAYYVDRECIDCDQCRHHAPAFFARNDTEAHSFVARQPETPDEIAACEEALDGCPAEAIGNDAGPMAGNPGTFSSRRP